MNNPQKPAYTNRLVNEISPYLHQHAHNPVDWHSWNEEALAKAKAENKPIFLSIGYSACHWCHRMRDESFEDPQVAVFMNEHFVNIKVDREERPDIDAIYMQATVAMTGSGGWPMSVFLTPDLKPFYAGTYFPPVPRYNMPSFKDVLAGIARTWQEQNGEAVRVGDEVSTHLRQALSVNVQSDTASAFTQAHLDAAVKSLLDAYDWGNGGWGAAPKFPQPMTIEFLLRRAILATENTESIEKENSENEKGEVENSPILKSSLHALKSMARGGMYDVVGGGFSRYSVDNFWRVPHFEKMLYDNAQLARAYLHAYQITGDPFFKQIVIETLGFIAREMTHPDGGFYSSLDADSEHEEGKFYVWTLDEIRAILKDDSDFFEAAYGITVKGNWEGKTVLQRALDDASLAARFKIQLEAVPAKLTDCHSKLLTARSPRVRPGTDDKVLTSWNGLMLATMAEASRVVASPEGATLAPGASAGEQSPHGLEIASSLPLVAPRNDMYYQLAARNAKFILRALRPDGRRLKHSWRDGKTTNEVFLEDYAALILGLIELYQTDFDNQWFASAKELADEMIERFNDPSGGFFDTSKDGENLLLRPKDVQDNATPSGNALACEALLKLAAFTDEGKYRDLAEKALGLVVGMATRYPTAFARWLSAADFALGNAKQVAVMAAGADDQQEGRSEADGDQASGLIRVVQSAYRPNVIIAASAYPPSDDAPALLKDRPLKDGKATVYVCEGFVCKNPVTTISELKELL